MEDTPNISFLITRRSGYVANSTKNTVILTWDDWNDYSYYTVFGLKYIDHNGSKKTIGSVRIAYFDQKTGPSEKKLSIGDSFPKLDDNYFSLGTDDSYYENLNELGDNIRDEILQGLRDIAKHEDIYERAINEDVTVNSLLRDISESTVTNQFRRIANGGARLTNYSFSYKFQQNRVEITPPKIEFDVIANSTPPTNIQIIIGRNGVGKSHLLNEMINSILIENQDKLNGEFIFSNDTQETFSNLICVTYSAFDEFQFHKKSENSKVKYHYIGLQNLQQPETTSKTNETNSIPDFSNAFTSSIGLIISSNRATRWKAAIKHLESDPIFKDEKFVKLIDEYKADEQKAIQEKFSKLSSGHKIILLTITRLVELLQEKSLIFFDEPETHLHPPLLSSFIRSLSELLTNRNAVCIMTTHSPIVLQEVPKSCVLKLSRKGKFAKFEKPELETFGENIGVLTNDVFGLEVTSAGFYNILKELVNTNQSYEEAMRRIKMELGVEGRAILRSLFFDKTNTDEKNK